MRLQHRLDGVPRRAGRCRVGLLESRSTMSALQERMICAATLALKLGTQDGILCRNRQQDLRPV